METLEEFERRVAKEDDEAVAKIQAAMLKHANGQTLDELWEILRAEGLPVSTTPQPNNHWRRALTGLLYQGKLDLTNSTVRTTTWWQ